MPSSTLDIINAGDLRRYVKVQTRSKTRTTGGDQAYVWSDLFSAYADLQPASGRERFAAGDVRNEATHSITMRYDSRLTANCRIVWKGRYFNIVGRPRNVAEEGSVMQFEAIEGLADG